MDAQESQKVIDSLGSRFGAVSSVVQEGTSLLLRNGGDIKGIGALFEAASASALASGTDINKALQNVAQGVATGRSELLEYAGIITNLGPVYQQYAKSLGKTTEQLSQQEKFQAAVNAIVNESKYEIESADAALTDYRKSQIELSRLQREFTQDIGGRVQGVFGTLNQLVGRAIQLYMGLSDETKDLIVRGATLVAGLTALATGAGLLLPVFTNVGLILASVGGAVASVGTKLAGFRALLGPVGLAVGGLFLAWQTNFLGIRDVTQRIFVEVGKFFAQMPVWVAGTKGVLQTLQGLFGGVFQGVGLILSGFRKVWQGAVADPVANVARGVGATLEKLADTFGAWVAAVGERLRPVAEFLSSLGAGIGETLTRWINSAKSFLNSKLSGAIGAAADRLEQMAEKSDLLAEGLSEIGQGARQVGAVVGASGAAIAASWNAATGAARANITAQQGAQGQARQTAQSLVDLSTVTDAAGGAAKETGLKMSDLERRLEALRTGVEEGSVGLRAAQAELKGMETRLVSQRDALRSGSDGWIRLNEDLGKVRGVLGTVERALADVADKNREASDKRFAQSVGDLTRAFERQAKPVDEVRRSLEGMVTQTLAQRSATSKGTEEYDRLTRRLETLQTLLGRVKEAQQAQTRALEESRQALLNYNAATYAGRPTQLFDERSAMRAAEQGIGAVQAALDQAASSGGLDPSLIGARLFDAGQQAVEQLRKALADGKVPEYLRESAEQAVAGWDEGWKQAAERIVGQLEDSQEGAVKAVLDTSKQTADALAFQLPAPEPPPLDDWLEALTSAAATADGALKAVSADFEADGNLELYQGGLEAVRDEYRRIAAEARKLGLTDVFTEAKRKADDLDAALAKLKPGSVNAADFAPAFGAEEIKAGIQDNLGLLEEQKRALDALFAAGLPLDDYKQGLGDIRAQVEGLRDLARENQDWAGFEAATDQLGRLNDKILEVTPDLDEGRAAVARWGDEMNRGLSEPVQQGVDTTLSETQTLVDGVDKRLEALRTLTALGGATFNDLADDISATIGEYEAVLADLPQGSDAWVLVANKVKALRDELKQLSGEPVDLSEAREAVEEFGDESDRTLSRRIPETAQDTLNAMQTLVKGVDGRIAELEAMVERGERPLTDLQAELIGTIAGYEAVLGDLVVGSDAWLLVAAKVKALKDQLAGVNRELTDFSAADAEADAQLKALQEGNQPFVDQSRDDFNKMMEEAEKQGQTWFGYFQQGGNLISSLIVDGLTNGGQNAAQLIADAGANVAQQIGNQILAAQSADFSRAFAGAAGQGLGAALSAGLGAVNPLMLLAGFGIPLLGNLLQGILKPQQDRARTDTADSTSGAKNLARSAPSITNIVNQQNTFTVGVDWNDPGVRGRLLNLFETAAESAVRPLLVRLGLITPEGFKV